MARPLSEIAACSPPPSYRACNVRLPGTSLTLDRIGDLQLAMAPLVPVFKIVEILTLLLNNLPIPSPTVIADLIDLIGDLAGFAPPVAVPLLLLDVLDCVIAFLSEMVNRFRLLEEFASELEAMAAYVLDNPGRLGLANQLACAENAFATDFASLSDQLQAINALMALIDLFFSLAGLGLSVPDMSSLSGLPLDAIITPLETIIDTLRTVCNTIPI